MTVARIGRRAINTLGAAALLAVWAAAYSPGAAQGGEARRTPPADSNVVRTVTASVEYSTERVAGKQATLAPGEFKVPEGSSAGQFRYRWADPKTGRESDRITATTVYSVTQRRYMSELKDNPNAVLPPGDYKLVVGGLPGAIGTLTYRLMPQTDPADPPSPPGPPGQSGDRIIDVETWLVKPTTEYNPKFKATYVVRQGKVTGTVDQLVESPNYGNGITADPMPYKGTFVGRIEGNVITGKWEEEILPHKMRFPPPKNTKFPAYDRTDSSTLKYEIRLVLNPDGSVSQTCKGTGETRLEWGPTAPDWDGHKSSTQTFTIEVPGEHVPDPLTGRWKERSAPRSAGGPVKP